MRMRLLPTDDLMHEPEEAQNFNESRYYNFFDRSTGFGGWVRMGNRVNCSPAVTPNSTWPLRERSNFDRRPEEANS